MLNDHKLMVRNVLATSSSCTMTLSWACSVTYISIFIFWGMCSPVWICLSSWLKSPCCLSRGEGCLGDNSTAPFLDAGDKPLSISFSSAWVSGLCTHQGEWVLTGLEWWLLLLRFWVQFLSMHNGQLTTACDSSFRGLSPLLWPLKAPSLTHVDMHTQTYTPAHN